MEYMKLGNTGLDVSRICLGTMGFGNPKSGFHEWVIEEEESLKIIKQALDLGINFFDTANVYSYGESERILGEGIKRYANRDEVVIATKVCSEMRKGPNGRGLSRKEIINQLDQSLERLQMDYVDLYIIHRWDYDTPIEETMRTLHDLVTQGKVRYIGASAMYAWQFAKAQAVAEKNGWTKFISMQNHLNLLYREEEREMLPLCVDQNIGVTPYSPLASGRLTRDWSATTKRFLTDKIAKGKYDSTLDQDKEIVDRVAAIAEKHDIERAAVSLAWLLQKKQVVSPIVGATKNSHLENAVKALEFALTEEEIAYLEETYVPHQVMGHF